MVYEIWVSNSLYLRQELKSVSPSGGTVHYVSPYSFLTLTASATPFRRYLPPQKLTLNQSVSVKKILNISLTTSLPLYERAATVYREEVWSNLFFWQTLTRLNFALADSVNFQQRVTVHRVKGAASRIDFTSTATAVVRFSRLQNLVLNFKSSAIGYILNDDIILQPIPATSTPDHVTLTYQDMELKLRRPTFGNLEKLNYSKVNRRTRGNALELYRDSTWPKFKRLSFDFENLTQAKAKEAQYFIRRSLGKDISIVDFQGLGWVGFIVTPEAEIVQQTRSGFNMSFELEGIET